MRVLLTGLTGFIGKKIGLALAERGDSVIGLVRNPSRAKSQLPFPAELYKWADVEEPFPRDSLRSVDAVIHLAGEPIAEGRWSKEKKQKIRHSRIAGTRVLVEALRLEQPSLKCLISSSAVGYYGFHEDEWLNESAAPGKDFLADVTKAWEEEALKARSFTRVVCVRTGMVLGRDGGALPKMLPAFKAGVGGRLGSGQQWVSWIHIDDLVKLYLFALDNGSLEGPINGVAPHPVRNVSFTHLLGTSLNRPSFIPVPAIALRALFGELADVLVKGQRVSAGSLQEAGFQFHFPTLESALENLVPRKT